MSESIPPPRSIVSIEPVPPEQGGGLLIGCDCGSITHLILAGLEELTQARELAVTCDGCQSSTWFTVTPVGDAPGEVPA